MDIPTTITSVLVALLGGGGGAALIKFLLEFIDKKRGNTLDAKLAPITKKLEEQQEELHQIRLDTTRTQLIMLMEHQPHNHDTILKVAERYFCQLSGDWYCTSLFRGWAKKENVNIPENIHQATLYHE